MRVPYSIEFAPDAAEQLAAVRKFDQVRIRDAIIARLTDGPDMESRHRKRLRSPIFAVYELRIGEFRVFYDVELKRQRCLFRRLG